MQHRRIKPRAYAHYVSEVNYYLNSNHTKYLAQLYILENLHRKYANLVAPPTDEV